SSSKYFFYAQVDEFKARRQPWTFPTSLGDAVRIAAKPHPVPSLQRSLLSVASQDKVGMDENGQKSILKSKFIPYGLSTWYTGIPSPEGLAVRRQVEGFLGLREHYRISSSGLYAAFDAVPSGSADDSKLVLGMYELRCPAKDEDGRILDGTVRLIAAEDPIT
ncbi:hypothetical protein FOZ62_008649, partial [Perkinsus olseni]